MLVSINPKLPMRNKAISMDYYIKLLGFNEFGTTYYPEYLMVGKDRVQIHFFLFKALDPLKNYGQVYIRTNEIDPLYQLLLKNNVPIHPNGKLETKPWGQKEFSLLEPDSNLLTFGQSPT